MRSYFKHIPYLIFIAIIVLVFKHWFLPGLITGGDFWPYFRSMYPIRSIFQYAWDWNSGYGMGSFVGSFLWIRLNFGLAIVFLGKLLNLDWSLIERIFYLFPFIILSCASSFLFFRKLFKENSFAIFSSAIYVLNTYILMLVGGGQVQGIGMSYSLLPFSLLLFFGQINNTIYKKLRYSIVLGLMISMQMLFDTRVGYLTIIIVGTYWIFQVLINRNVRYTINSLVFSFLMPGLLSLLLHSFWILPTIVSHQNPIDQLGTAYYISGAVKYFSFAKFEDAITLLHPNWPENIFGKVYFMRPEFLVLPVLTYSSLFFVKKLKEARERFYILFFSLVGIIGAFLAKGLNEPFGNVYLWLFNNVPGFVMFRDPTKWYIFITISYSVLIPFTIRQIYEWLKSKDKFSIKNSFLNIQNTFLLFLILYFLFLIRPALFSQLSGTFQTAEAPNEYIALEKFLSSQSDFSRTLWVPQQQRFGYYSASHPAIPANDYFSLYDDKSILSKLEMSEKLLQESAVKYVIVPDDSQGEIFLNDRKYDNKLYLSTLSEVKRISWLKQIQGFGKIAVFQVPDSKDHFWTPSKTLSLKYQYISPVEYNLNVSNAQKGDLIIFAENYDKNWIARNNETGIQSTMFDKRFNSFVLTKNGDYSLSVYYSLQDWVNLGMAISLITLTGAFVVLTILVIKKK